MGVLGLILIFVIGTLRPINLGALALVMTFLVGSLIAGQDLRVVYSGFPVELFVLLAGVTYLFAIAASNGTVERIVDSATHLIGARRALIPGLVFLVASLPAMAGALGSAGVALLAPISMRLARRYEIDRRMIGLMVVHGAAAGNFSPLNVLGAIVVQAVQRSGLELSPLALFLANLAYNVGLAVVIFVVFGGLRLTRQPTVRTQAVLVAAGTQASPNDFQETQAGSSAEDWLVAAETTSGTEQKTRLGASQICTLVALLAVAVAALFFGLNIGFLALAAAILLHLLFPLSSNGADRKIAWGVILLVCGIVTYVAALQRIGTVQVIGNAMAELNSPLGSALLICVVGAVTSAFASSAGILAAMIPLAIPLMMQGAVGTTGMVIALAISVTAVDATPFSTVGALVVANADDDERPRIYRGVLWWGAAMVLTAPLVTWLLFILPARQ